jgi:serine protease AprX
MRTSTVREHDHNHAQNRFAVLPTCLRLGLDPSRTARGVTIALLDSGFYPHPDLTQPVNRIVAYRDVTRPSARLDPADAPENWDWHGTMTSVAAAGNGYLSNGVYRGLASEASVVLVKVGDAGRITERNIERGLRWVIANRERYGIRVVSISLGGDEDVSYRHNAVDQAAEAAVKEGLVVVVAAGNSGCTDKHKTVPPANSPSVITVGGYDDNNQLDGPLDLYCSSYGETADGLIKPEIVAPAIWVAAPILPRTVEYDRAQALSRLALAPDYELETLRRPRNTRDWSEPDEVWRLSELDDSLRNESGDRIRSEAEAGLRKLKIVSTHYQHVDGTSFAAPVVASLVAQMLEINPRLIPQAIKHILISTADRIHGAPAIRQGYGAVNARRALEHAATERHVGDSDAFSPPRVVDGKLEFVYHDHEAENLAVAGDFNEWNPTEASDRRDGVFRVAVDLPSPGRYRYKFVVDRTQWVDDPGNAVKEADGYGGNNSIVHIDGEGA